MNKIFEYLRNGARSFGKVFFTTLSIALSLILVMVIIGLFSGPGSSEAHIYGASNARSKILSLPVSGTILGQSTGGGGSLNSLLGGEPATYGYDVKEELATAADDESIKGIVLEIDSPGGTINGAQAIADGVALYRSKTGHPVIAHIGGLAASGGYWAAASADAIYADYGSTIGSIGVIFGPFTYYDKPIAESEGLLGATVLTQNGIESTSITAGRGKDIGNPYRRLTDEEKNVLQKSVDNEYGRFVSYVAKQRSLDEETIRTKIGALVYDNASAESYKLINGTLGRDAAYEETAKRAGLSTDGFQVVRHEQPQPSLFSLLSSKLGLGSSASQTQGAQVDACLLTKNILAYHGSVSDLCH